MGNDRSLDQYVGLLMHDYRADEIWEDESTYTEAGPRAGDPIPSDGVEFNLQASGPQTDEVLVATQRSGLPVMSISGAGVRWRYDTTEDWRGHNVPHMVQGWEPIEWTASGVLEEPSKHPSAVTMKDGTIVLAYDHDDLLLGRIVKIGIRDPDSGLWSSAVAFSGSSSGGDLHPCLTLLKDQRILLTFTQLVSGEIQLLSSYSDDSGATWSEDRYGAFLETIDNTTYDVIQMASCYNNGQVALFAVVDVSGTPYNELWQWVSYDSGSSFSFVASQGVIDTTYKGYVWVDCVSINNKILLSTTVTTTVFTPLGSKIWNRLLGSASQSFLTSDYVAIDGVYVESHAVVNDGGNLFLYKSATYASRQVGYPFASYDGGLTWERIGLNVGSNNSHWYNCNDPLTGFSSISAVSQRGRTLIFHNIAASPGTNQNSLGCLSVGSFSNVTMPTLVKYPTERELTSWDVTYFPFDLPGNCGWVASGVGTEALVDGYLNIVTTANTKYYEVNPAGSVDEGLLIRAALKVTTGTVTSGGLLRMRLADGTDDYDISLFFGRLGARLIDNNNGGATITPDTGYTAGSDVEYKVSFAGGSVKIWWRVQDKSEDMIWALGWSSTTLVNDTTTPAANHLIRWGNSATSTVETDWRELHYTSDQYTGVQLINSSFPDDLWPRQITQEPVYIAGGLWLSASDGKTVIGDSWTCPVAYDYALDRILPFQATESPRKGWRSTADGVDAYIAISLDSTPVPLDTDILGLAIHETNLNNVVLQGNVGTLLLPVWSDLMTISASAGANPVRWTRRGGCIVPATLAGTDTPYLLRGDYDGGSFSDGTNYQEIVRQVEGRMAPATVGGEVKQTVIYLDSAGSLGSTGTSGLLMAPRMAGILKLNGSEYAGYRLKIPAQTTKDGDYRIGTICLGPLVVMGSRPSRGRALTLQPGNETETYRDKTRSDYVAAPQSYIVEISWVEGVPTCQAFNSEEPDYVVGGNNASAMPVASLADLPFMLEGLYGQLEGSASAITYFGRVDKANTLGEPLLFTSREDFKLGYLSGDIRREAATGDESNNEVIRVSTVPFTEIK